jgi:hypothetical protein
MTIHSAMNFSLFFGFTNFSEGTGKLQGKYHLELDENATPIVYPPRKVPVAIKERLRNELERLTKMDIIKPVSTPTPWGNAKWHPEPTIASKRSIERCQVRAFVI